MIPDITVQGPSQREMEARVKRTMTLLKGSELLVGIPAEENTREGEPIGNAAIGYIQEFGAPEAGIPARAFLYPGMKAAAKDITDLLADAARAALRGDAGGVMAGFHAAGQVAVNAVTARFVDNDWPALADATLAARWRAENPADPVPEGGKRKHRKAGKPARSNPLIFRGALRNAITYVIRRRGQ
ncbi:hypothetical protein [Rhodospirillum sp. A1_3_36]|uniref:hypothetical protein n=1 Tax=Rhodospirillum sp. A1_3_36 TaxID=3391666 RepID=UPI0039A68751